jgi:tetratricopeptide (TPR) repeat protein
MTANRLLFLVLLLPFSVAAQSLDEGIALFTARKYGEAKALFESILKNDEKNGEAHYRLGLILLTNQFLDADAAVDHMEEAVDINPSNADYQYGLGAAYGIKARDAGIIKQALLAPKVKGAFEKAVKLNPRHVEAQIGLAQYYQRAPGIMGGDVAKALAAADRVVELDELRGRSLKANLLVSEKRIPEAAQEMKRLTSNRSKEWRAWRTAGIFYWRNQMADEALASFEKYVTLRPDTADSHTFLARAYVQKKDAEKAITFAKKALSIDGNFAPAYDAIGQAYELKGERKEAKEAYQKLLAMNLSQNQKKEIEKKIRELQ